MNEELEKYILAHIDREPDTLVRIYRATHQRTVNPRMASGHWQGRVLAMFCRMIQPRYILELGAFTGYSTLCLAEQLPADGVLHTIELNDELEDFIRPNIASYGERIRLHFGDALTIIPTLEDTFDLVFIDADKREYEAYYAAIFDRVRPGGFIIADNTLWDGKVIQPDILANDRQTQAILRFNDLIAQDERIEKVIIPIRDGMTVIFKK